MIHSALCWRGRCFCEEFGQHRAGRVVCAAPCGGTCAGDGARCKAEQAQAPDYAPASVDPASSSMWWWRGLAGVAAGGHTDFKMCRRLAHGVLGGDTGVLMRGHSDTEDTQSGQGSSPRPCGLVFMQPVAWGGVLPAIGAVRG